MGKYLLWPLVVILGWMGYRTQAYQEHCIDSICVFGNKVLTVVLIESLILYGIAAFIMSRWKKKQRASAQWWELVIVGFVITFFIVSPLFVSGSSILQILFMPILYVVGWLYLLAANILVLLHLLP